MSYLTNHSNSTFLCFYPNPFNSPRTITVSMLRFNSELPSLCPMEITKNLIWFGVVSLRKKCYALESSAHHGNRGFELIRSNSLLSNSTETWIVMWLSNIMPFMQLISSLQHIEVMGVLPAHLPLVLDAGIFPGILVSIPPLRCAGFGCCYCTGRWGVLDNTHGKDSGAFCWGLLYSHYHDPYF